MCASSAAPPILACADLLSGDSEAAIRRRREPDRPPRQVPGPRRGGVCSAATPTATRFHDGDGYLPAEAVGGGPAKTADRRPPRRRHSSSRSSRAARRCTAAARARSWRRAAGTRVNVARRALEKAGYEPGRSATQSRGQRVRAR
ncbi:hypothetical protein LV779_34455 [Streptomyces thinghirensis]|nr:hypothetical protein [Streptomyces thinghirensis]